MKTAKELEEMFGVTAEQLDEWEKEAAQGILPGEHCGATPQIRGAVAVRRVQGHAAEGCGYGREGVEAGHEPVGLPAQLGSQGFGKRLGSSTSSRKMGKITVESRTYVHFASAVLD